MVIVVAAVVVLSSPLADGWWPAVSDARTAQTTVAPTTLAETASTQTSTIAPTSTTEAGSAGPVDGAALLVVLQGGSPAVFALVSGGPDRGVVLGMPSVTLLRVGDRFERLADVYTSPDDLSGPEQAVSDVLDASIAAVASIEWSDLRQAVTGAVGGSGLPEELDGQGADAGAVAAVLAGALSAQHAGSVAAGGWLADAHVGGDRDAFLASLEAESASMTAGGWEGQAITGRHVEYAPGAAYLEPDVQAAKSILAGTSARPGSGS